MNQYETRVISVSERLQGVKRSFGRNIESSFVITFHCPEIAVAAEPGQFLMVNCEESGNTLPRPFSIHRVNGDEISLYIARLEGGTGTGWLSERKPEDKVKILGPLGNGFTLEESTRSIVLLAGGMGIAPMIFLAERAIEKGIDVTILYGIPGGQRFPVEKVLPEANVVIASEDGSEGYKGLVTDLLSKYKDTVDQVCICGPTGMYKAILSNRDNLLGMIPTQVSLETRMACGRGICYGCTIETVSGVRRVCEDGPVFDLNEILP